MNNIKSLYDLYSEVERISRSLPNVNTFTESFDNLNRENVEYSAVVFQFRDGTQPSEGFVTYRFYLGYVDRVNEVNGSPSSNETLIQSVAEQSLRTIINKVNEEVEFKYGSLTPFEQRFTALTAGCYIDCSVTLAVSDCNYESGSVLRDLNIYVDKNMKEEFIPGPGVDGFKKVNLEVNIPLDKCVQVVEQEFTDDEKRIARENINAIEDEAGVIDTEHIATGAVTSEKLSVDVQTELENNSRLIINYNDTRIPAVYWDLLYVTSDEKIVPITVIPNIVFVDEYGNIFSLQKVLPGDDDTSKRLRFDAVYCDSDPGRISVSDAYVSATDIIVHQPTDDWCEIEVTTNESDLSNIISSAVTEPLILADGNTITANEFWRYFTWSIKKLTIINPVYIRGSHTSPNGDVSSGELTLVTSATMSKYTDPDNFVVILYSEHSNVDGSSTDCGAYGITITFTGGKATIPSGRTLINPLVKLTRDNATTFARSNSDYNPGKSLKANTTIYQGGGVFLWNPSQKYMWMKVPWVSEVQLTALKAALIARFPDADSEHIVQVYKSIYKTIADPITVGDSIAGYDVIVTGTKLSDTMFYFL